MSKILDGLKDLERQRLEQREGPVDDPALLDDARSAEAAALKQAGADECARRQAEEQAQTDTALLAAVQRREAAERLAAAQARGRGEAEAAAETVAAERAHAERLLETAVRMRVEAEEKALADAKRREFAAAELATAAAQRARREQEAEALARERADSERRAADLASETIRAEQAAEAAALARVAVERDMVFHSERRVMQEAAARQAEADRQRADLEAAEATQSGVPVPTRASSPLLPSPDRSLAPAAVPPGPTFPGARIRLLLALAVAMLVGLGSGYWLGTALTRSRQEAAITGLRLDTDAEGLARRIARAERWRTTTEKPRR